MKKKRDGRRVGEFGLTKELVLGKILRRKDFTMEVLVIAVRKQSVKK